MFVRVEGLADGIKDMPTLSRIPRVLRLWRNW